MSTTSAQGAAAITTKWPQGFPAERAGAGGFAVREVAAPADAVFAWIRRVDLHPEFYGPLKFVKRFSGSWPELDKGTALTFTIGLTFVPYLKVTHCDPTERTLAWGGGGPGLAICHAWTVEPIDEHRSLIRSEERWVGAVGQILKPVTQPTIQKVQTQWTEAIVRAAEAHPAGPPTA